MKAFSGLLREPLLYVSLSRRRKADAGLRRHVFDIMTVSRENLTDYPLYTMLPLYNRYILTMKHHDTFWFRNVATGQLKISCLALAEVASLFCSSIYSFS